jgi:hypothetical protein
MEWNGHICVDFISMKKTWFVYLFRKLHSMHINNELFVF